MNLHKLSIGFHAKECWLCKTAIECPVQPCMNRAHRFPMHQDCYNRVMVHQVGAATLNFNTTTTGTFWTRQR